VNGTHRSAVYYAARCICARSSVRGARSVRAAHVQLMIEATGAALLEMPRTSANTWRRSINSMTAAGVGGLSRLSCSTTSIATLDELGSGARHIVNPDFILRTAGADSVGSSDRARDQKAIRAFSPSWWAALWP
jgi:hypothetical protein